MIDQLLAELRKMRSTRTNLGLLAGMVALILLSVLLTGLLAAKQDLLGRYNQHQLLSAGTSAAFFASLIGVMAITSEFRHGTIRPTFVVTPPRSRVVAAKVTASLMMGLAFGVLATVLALGVGYAVLAGRGIELELDTSHVLLLVLGSIGMTACWAAVGVGLGAVVRNQVLPIVGLIVWVLIVDGILREVVPGVGRFTPSAASASMTTDPETYLLAPLAGALILVAYAVAFVAAGTVLTARRDVT
jgi:ABC-2 type transport system permease protein